MLPDYTINIIFIIIKTMIINNNNNNNDNNTHINNEKNATVFNVDNKISIGQFSIRKDNFSSGVIDIPLLSI